MERIVVIGVKTVGMKVKPVQRDLDTCSGFTSGSATFCMMQWTAGACSVDDQSSFSDNPDDIGKKAGDPGNSSCEHTENVILRSCVALRWAGWPRVCDPCLVSRVRSVFHRAWHVCDRSVFGRVSFRWLLSLLHLALQAAGMSWFERVSEVRQQMLPCLVLFSC